ncbi:MULTISPECIES: DUF202 domain-containing protein [Niallia]|uniref:YidH family protein n=1 Tax=Niallia TaxID=2837506 RepID=UPI0015F51EB2|nr:MULTISPECIES: DUF202 domain-containing protein [Niallia]UPO91223.1 DUF202 domain-containing protein [Niallia sp. Man26]GKU85126.1 hypothetical protein NCCP28_45220 [Niallia sp. NCCP-28]
MNNKRKGRQDQDPFINKHNQLKYAQQHLANERTYLAWIRTVVSIVGIGFLTTSLHFTIGVRRNLIIDMFSVILGIFACILGIAVILLATKNYSKNKLQIYEERFNPSNIKVNMVSTFMIILIIMVIIYFLLIKF